jgi:hypothetical protein
MMAATSATLGGTWRVRAHFGKEAKKRIRTEGMLKMFSRKRVAFIRAADLIDGQIDSPGGAYPIWLQSGSFHQREFERMRPTRYRTRDATPRLVGNEIKPVIPYLTS